MPEKNKLSASQKAEIIKKHTDEHRTFAELAREYNVSGPAIAYIVRRAMDRAAPADAAVEKPPGPKATKAKPVAKPPEPEPAPVTEAPRAKARTTGRKDTAAQQGELLTPESRARTPKAAPAPEPKPQPAAKKAAPEVRRETPEPAKAPPGKPAPEKAAARPPAPAQPAPKPAEAPTATRAPVPVPRPATTPPASVQPRAAAPRERLTLVGREDRRPAQAEQPQPAPRPPAAAPAKPAEASQAPLTKGAPVVEAAVGLASAFETWDREPSSGNYERLDEAFEFLRRRVGELEIEMLTR